MTDYTDTKQVTEAYTLVAKDGQPRTPSYTDRILFHSLPDLHANLVCTEYNAVEALFNSDHKPVVALTTVTVAKGMQDTKRLYRLKHPVDITKPVNFTFELTNIQVSLVKANQSAVSLVEHRLSVSREDKQEHKDVERGEALHRSRPLHQSIPAPQSHHVKGSSITTSPLASRSVSSLPSASNLLSSLPSARNFTLDEYASSSTASIFQSVSNDSFSAKKEWAGGRKTIAISKHDQDRSVKLAYMETVFPIPSEDPAGPLRKIGRLAATINPFAAPSSKPNDMFSKTKHKFPMSDGTIGQLFKEVRKPVDAASVPPKPNVKHARIRGRASLEHGMHVLLRFVSSNDEVCGQAVMCLRDHVWEAYVKHLKLLHQEKIRRRKQGKYSTDLSKDADKKITGAAVPFRAALTLAGQVTGVVTGNVAVAYSGVHPMTL